MNPKKYNILFLLAVVYVAISAITKNTIMPYGYIAVLLAYSILDIRLGLSALLLILPIVGVLEGDYLALMYSPVVVLMYIVKLFNESEKLWKNNYKFFFIILSLLAFIGMLFTGYMDYSHVWLLFILNFLVISIIIQQIIKDEENVFLIANAFIIAGVLATLTSYFLSGGEFRRLALGESIRQLSNIIGLGLILLVGLYYFKKRPQNNLYVIPQYRIINRLKILIIIVFIFGLISTMSRGVIASVSVSILSLIAFAFFRNIKEFNIHAIAKGSLFLGLLFSLGLYYGNTVLDKLNIQTDVLAGRLSGEEVEGGTAARMRIWEAGISGLEGSEILYGHGMSSFKMLANKKGYNYYSHSVFVDTFVTTGILGIIVLIAMYLALIKGVLWYRDIVIFSLILFSIVNYITHGSITSSGFWYSIAICIGLLEFKRLNET